MAAIDQPDPEHDAGSGRSNTENDIGWAVDAAVGAAARMARTAGAVGGSAPARFLAGAAKRATRPLSREGEHVRQQIEHDAGPTAQRVVRQVTPRVVDAVDLNGILAAIDLDALLERIDLGKVLDRLDLNALMAKIDLDALLDQVDLNALMAKLDFDALLDQVDLNALMAKLDLGQLLDRIDVNEVIGKVDINGIVSTLDVDSLVTNTELGGLIAKSTTGVASSALDAVRAQGVGLDEFVERWTSRVLRRDPATVPDGPPKLVPAEPLALPPVESAVTNGTNGTNGTTDTEPDAH